MFKLGDWICLVLIVLGYKWLFGKALSETIQCTLYITFCLNNIYNKIKE